MATKKELIQFVLTNATNCDFTIPMFENNVPSINATTKYSWDITSESLACGFGSIIINGIVYNFTFDGTLSGLLSSLNSTSSSVGCGFFCFEVVVGNTFVYVVDDNCVFGDLSLCGTITTTTTSTTTSTTTIAPSTSTTTSTTTAPSTSTTTSTTTGVLTTSTTSTTTTAPSTSTTTSTTTAPSTSTTTSTTTGILTTSTTSTTTTAASTSTTTSTTTAPSTTTTSTTTSTTTILVYNIALSNGSLDISVTQVDYNGITATVVGGVLPNTTGNGTQLLQDQQGSFSLNVYWTATVSGQHITVTDSNGTITCQGTSIGTGTLSFGSVVWDGITPITIDSQDGIC